ncbi:MAG TPA: hypothetical protein VMB34_32215 [Acetobacteraceae bacterium]|nr:hypothetical protein [Acetobacteraceae bacterium]
MDQQTELSPADLRRVAARWRHSARSMAVSSPDAATVLERKALDLLRLAYEREVAAIEQAQRPLGGRNSR